jgi:sugar transferase (PEP-CTERM/EpsH1 system associated)
MQQRLKDDVMTTPITIAHVVPSFGCGGLERVIANLINETAPERAKHVIISLTDDFTMLDGITADAMRGVTTHCLHKRPGKDIACHGRLFTALRHIKPDVMQTYNFGTIEYHGVAALAGVKRRIHADHGLGGDDPKGNNTLHNRFRQAISVLIQDYVVVSDDLSLWVRDTVGVPSKKVSKVLNGVDVPSRPASLAPPPSDAPFRLLSVGRLAPVKNQALLLDAMALIQRQHPTLPIALDLIGDGPERAALNARHANLLYPERVVLHGLVMDPQGHFERCDAFVLSSNYEAMPMTVLEAMAQCKPVICTQVGGVADFISEQEAILIPPGDPQIMADAIVAMYRMHHDERQALALRGHARVRDCYSLEKMANTYLRLYKH